MKSVGSGNVVVCSKTICRVLSAYASFNCIWQGQKLVYYSHKKLYNTYRFQVAGYRDEKEYKQLKNLKNDEKVERWPDSGYVKKLQRKDGTFYYYSKDRECKEKDVNRTKLYAY